MEPTLIMRTAVVLLTITALGGLVMAIIRFKSETNPPNWLAMLHGLLAAAALTLLLYAFFTVGLPRLAGWGLLLFVIAALGGVFLNLAYQTKMLPLPKSIVIVHAALAVAGYALLLIAAFQSS
jgi:hypothetical protein